MAARPLNLLPPGFELEQPQGYGDLPPGFQLEQSFGSDLPEGFQIEEPGSVVNTQQPSVLQPGEPPNTPVADRKIINGREYTLGKESGLVFDDKLQRVNDPEILKAFGVQPEPGLMDYGKEFGSATVRGAASTVSSMGSGLGVMTSDDAGRIADVEKGIANLSTMTPEQATSFVQSLPSQLSPAVAFNYQVAIRKLWRGDTEGAKPYLEAARKYTDTTPVDQQALTKGGKQLEAAAKSAFPQDPRFKGSITSDLGQGLGSTAAFLPIAMLTGGTGVAVTGALAGADQSYRQAQGSLDQMQRDRLDTNRNAYGAEKSNQMALEAGRLGALPGASEVVPIEAFVEQMPKFIPGLRAIASTPVWGRFAKAFGRMATQAVAEGGQEAFQQWASNVINKLKIDANQDVTEDVLYNALIGAGIGAGMQAPVEAYNAVAGNEEEVDAPRVRVDPPPPRPRIEPRLFPDAGTSAGPGAPGAPPTGPAPTPTHPVVTGASAEDYLAAAGYTDEMIADMNPGERDAALREAIAAGVEPAPRPLAPPTPPGGGMPSSATAGPAEGAPASGTTFQTAKGSTYEVHEDGTTTRNKVYRPEHGPAEQGPQPRSQTTFYLPQDQLDALSLMQTEGGHEMSVQRREDGSYGIRLENGPDKGKFIRGTIVQPEAKPAVGLTPVELWKDGRVIHFGNPITSVSQAPQASTAPAPGTAPMAPRGTRSTKVNVQSEQDLEAVRPTVNAAPSEAQKKAGNYQLAHVKLHGLDISIENPKGSIRRGTDPNGETWESPPMPADYGYAKGSKARDGDHVDIFIGGNPASQKVFVIDQRDLKTGRFDEPKVILGADSISAALSLYEGSFSDGRAAERVGAINETTPEELKQWLDSGPIKKPFAKTSRSASERWTGEARSQSSSGVPNLEGDENAVPQSQQQPVSGLRGPGNSDLSGVADRLRGIPAGYGAEAQPSAYAGQDQYGRPLQPDQLPVGNPRGAESQPSPFGAADIPGQDAASGGVGGGAANFISNAQEAGQQGLGYGTRTDAARAVDANRALDDYLAGKKPLTQEAFAKSAGITTEEAGKALQRAHMAGRIVLGRNGQYRRPPQRVAPLDVLSYLASKGGVSDPTGELRGMDLHKAMTPYGPVVRPKGMHPDKAREALVEAGYMADAGRDTGGQAQSTVADFYDVMGRAAGGEKIYVMEDQAKADAIRDTKRNEDLKPEDWADLHPIERRWGSDVWNKLQQFWAENGSYEEAWSPQEVNDAAIMVADGMEADDAFEKAAAMHVDDILNEDDLAPEITAAFEKNRANAMEAFRQSSPAWDLEEGNAAQQQGSPAPGDGVGPVGEGGQDGDGQAEVPRPAAQVRDAGEGGSEAGSAGDSAGTDEAGRDQVGNADLLARISACLDNPESVPNPVDGAGINAAPVFRKLINQEATYERLGELRDLVRRWENGARKRTVSGKSKKAKAQNAEVERFNTRLSDVAERLIASIAQKRDPLLIKAMEDAGIKFGDTVRYTEGVVDSRTGEAFGEPVEGEITLSNGLVSISSGGGIMFLSPDDIRTRLQKIDASTEAEWTAQPNENGVLEDSNPVRTVNEKAGGAKFTINVIEAKPGKFVTSHDYDLQGQSGGNSPATTRESSMFDTPEEAIADAASRILRHFEYDFRNPDLPDVQKRNVKKIILKLKELGGKSAGTTAEPAPEPTTETGADNKPQTVIPGAEQKTPEQAKAAAAAEAAAKELELRQKQSKLRKGGQQSVEDQAGGMFAPPPPPSLFDEPAEKPAATATAKIEDFGEKILGARKDAVRDIVRSLEEDVDLAAEPLSKSFPQPDYQKLADAGVDRKALALVAVMRNTIPSKPKKGWKVKAWVENVNVLRGFAQKLLNGTVTADEIAGRMRGDGKSLTSLSQIADTADVIYSIDPKLLPFAGQFSIHRSQVSMLNGIRFSPAKNMFILEDGNKRWVDVNAETLADIKEPALNYIKAQAEKQSGESKGRKTPISLYKDRKTGQIYLGFSGLAGQVIRLKAGFDTIKDARTYLADHADELQKTIDDMREGPAMRRAANMPRTGEPRREGDVSPEQFGEAFGFRGVQFGNYVEGDRRQSDLNEAFDALMDMADVLGVPPRALSLNGELGLAFGARGHGGKNAALAHYEPGQVVINLTKNSGAGSLAHEWLHAVDHYFSRQNISGMGRSYISEARQRGEVREAVWNAWKEIEKSITKGPFKERAVELDKAKSKPYYSTTIELAARAFERYIVARLDEKGASNDYLANLELRAPQYPTAEELHSQGIRKAFDDLFSALDVKWSPDRKKAALFSVPRILRRSNNIPASAKITSGYSSTDELLAHPEYRAAKAGDPRAAGALVSSIVPASMISHVRDNYGPSDIFLPVSAIEQSGTNAIPGALARYLAAVSGGSVETGIVQSSKAKHTQANPMERLLRRPTFDGPVKPGGRYVLVDDVTVMGGTLAELANHIRANGGEVAGVATLVNTSRNGLKGLSPATTDQIRDIERRYGNEVRAAFGVEPSALTFDEAQYIRNFRDADALRARVAAARGAGDGQGGEGNVSERSPDSKGPQGRLSSKNNSALSRNARFDAMVSKAKNRRASLQQEVETDLERHGVFVASEPGTDKSITVTPSIYEDGMLQVTYFTGEEPTGHFNVRPENVGQELLSFSTYRRRSPQQSRLASIAKPVFYSGLLRAVEGMRQEKAPKAQWMGMIRNAPGVKPEELAWVGLEDWLSQQGGQITKQQIADFIRANQVKVEEIIKGAPVESPDLARKRDRFQELVDIDDGSGPYTGRRRDLTPQEKSEYDALLTDISQHGNPWLSHEDTSRWKSQTLPGGDNYRELLLTGPDVTSTPSERNFNRFIERMEQKYGPDFYDALTDEEIHEYDGLSDAAYEEKAIPAFTHESHWSEPNVLAHIRFNERVGADGKRVLFIEEIQSDWHQQGRKKGYRGATEVAALEEARKKVWEMRGPLYDALARNDFLGFENRASAIRGLKENNADAWEWNSPEDQAIGQAYHDAITAQIEAQKAVESGVPDAPFKTSWPELAMKRAIRWAAEHGFDRVAWTPGEVQANRYDLSRHIERIAYQKRGDSYALWFSRKGAGKFESMGEHSASQLENQVGKEIAEKIIAGEGKQIGFYGFDKGTMSLDGLDLKVGGEGMKGFYDKILVDVANRLGKKFGAKVSSARLPGAATYEQLVEAGRQTGLTQQQLDAMSVAERKRLIDQHTPTFPSFEITDAMKQAALEGQPLFKRKQWDVVTPGQNRYRFAISRKQRAELVADINEVAQRILGRQLAGVSILDNSDLEDAYFDPNTGIIHIALQGTQDARATIRHEAIHALRQAGVITAHEWAILSRMARSRWIEQYSIRERYERLYRERFDITPAQLEELLIEEAIADAMADHWLQRPAETVPGRIFAKLKAFLEALRNALRGRGFTTAEQILGKAESGELGQRRQGTGQGRDFLLWSKQDSQPRDVTQSEAFRNWFGDSKVVDALGRPLVVYHGAPDARFVKDSGVFQTASQRYSGRSDGGVFWFAKDRSTASTYADDRRAFDYQAAEPGVVEVYLKMENPLIVDGGGKAWRDAQSRGKTTDVIQEAQANGYDGVIIRNVRDDYTGLGRGSVNRATDTYAVFSSNQIKSATGNNGNFDPAKQSMLEARPRLRPPRRPAPGSFEAPHDERVLRALMDSTDTLLNRISRAGSALKNRVQRGFQDREVDLARTQAAITKASGPIPETLDAYLAASLYPGRVAQRDQDLVEDFIKPLIEDIAARKLTLEEVNDFLMLRHATERNLATGAIAKPGTQFAEALTNPAIKGGSGFSENEIRAGMARFRAAGKMADLTAIGNKVVALNGRTLDSLHNEGLITTEQYDALTTKYRYYVPLRGWDDITDETNPDSPRSGRRFDIRGKEIHSAFGRTTKADSPLAYSILQARQALIRVEKNRVGKRFLRLAEANPNPAFWEINRVELKKAIDKNTGYVRNVFDPGANEAENVYSVKVGGKRYNITLHHEGLLRAMKGIGGENMGDIFGFFAKINRYFSAINTSYSPEFLFTNFMRDLQHAGIVLQEERVRGLTTGVLKSIPQAFEGMRRMLLDDLSTPWARYTREFADAGGKIGFMDRTDIEAEKAALDRLMREANAGMTGQLWLKIKEHSIERIARWNDSLENTLRLATYVQLRRAGISQDKAASVARELTVNFNRKGEYSPMLNSLWLFFNAATQGTAQLLTRLMRSKKVRIVAAGIVVESLIMGLINGMIAGDDDDDKNRYDKIPDDIKARYHIFMLSKELEKKYGVAYIRVPLPLGWNIFHVAGEQAAAVLRGAVSPLDAAANVASSIGDAFNVLGNGGTFLNTLAPTILDPLVNITANVDDFGKALIPDQFDKTTPNAERYYPNVAPWAKFVTDELSALTGGSPERKGAIDLSPEWVEYVAKWLGGGITRFVGNATTTAQDWSDPQEFDVGKVPFVRVFAGRPAKFEDRNEYYRIRDAIHVTEKEIKARIAEGKTEEASQLRVDHAREVKMISLVDAAEKRLAKLRKTYKAVKNSPKMGEDLKRQRLEELAKQMDDIQLKVRTRWNQLDEQGMPIPAESGN